MNRKLSSPSYWLILPGMVVLLLLSMLACSFPFLESRSNISPTDQPTRGIEVVGQVGGVTRAIAIQGEYAYAGIGARLVVLDMRDPAAPRAVGQSSPLAGVVEDLAFSGNYAYVALGAGGLAVVDISRPQAPRVVDTDETDGLTDQLAVAGDYLVRADSFSALRVMDIRDRAHPVRTGFYRAAEMYAQGLVILGETAYVSDFYGGLRSIDISDPTSPTQTSAYEPGNFSKGLAIQGDMAYLSTSDAFLRAIDLSDPAAPVARNTIPESFICDVEQIVIAGDYAYLVEQRDGLLVINISEPNRLRWAGKLDLPDMAYSLAVAGNTVYLGGEFGGVQVVDISDPTHPTLVGAYQAPGQVEHVAVSGQTAYLLDPDSLWAVDIRDPTNPRVVGAYDTPYGADGVAARGDRVYLAIGDLLVLDASDPANLSELASYELGEYNAQSLDICGGYAFMDTFWEMGSELVVIDLSDPANPVRVGGIEDAGWNYMAEADGVIYVLHFNGNLRAMDFSNPLDPQVLEGYRLSGEADGLAVAGSTAFVPEYHGLRVVDISSPGRCRDIAFFNSPSEARDVAYAGGHIYLANYSAGMMVLRYPAANP